MIKDRFKTVFQRVMGPDEQRLDPKVARTFLNWNFSKTDIRRIDELAAKSRQTGLTDREAAEFREYCAVADILSLLHLRARSALRSGPRAAGA